VLPSLIGIHTVIVETQSGEGSSGDIYGPPTVRQCFVDEARQLVRAQSGAEVVSEATIFDTLDADSIYVSDSRVTLPSGRVAYVITAKRRDDGGMGIGLAHLEVAVS